MSQTPDPLVGVTIQSREIYDAVVRLTGRVDVLINQHDEVRGDVKDHETRIRQLEANQPRDHEPRIRNLEASKWPLQSVSILLALGALILTFVKNFL